MRYGTPRTICMEGEKVSEDGFTEEQPWVYPSTTIYQATVGIPFGGLSTIFRRHLLIQQIALKTRLCASNPLHLKQERNRARSLQNSEVIIQLERYACQNSV